MSRLTVVDYSEAHPHAECSLMVTSHKRCRMTAVVGALEARTGRSFHRCWDHRDKLFVASTLAPAVAADAVVIRDYLEVPDDAVSAA